jgi:hypothetical protein
MELFITFASQLMISLRAALHSGELPEENS